jgi:hypothetical protein
MELMSKSFKPLVFGEFIHCESFKCYMPPHLFVPPFGGQQNSHQCIKLSFKLLSNAESSDDQN